ncbi:hypothetical protein [Geopseudomonas aromaticivorans]
MKFPEANEYLAVLVDDTGHVLLRSKPGEIGGYFIRTKLSGGKSPEVSVIEAVFNESGLMVKIASIEDGLHFGGNGTCACVTVELAEPAGRSSLVNNLVDWYSIDEARRLISTHKKDNEYTLEINALLIAQKKFGDSINIKKDGLIGLPGSQELESLKKLCICIERIFMRDKNFFQVAGTRLDLVTKFLDEAWDGFNRKKIDADYVDNLNSKIGKRVRSKAHECHLEELILISSSEAYYYFKNDSLAGYKKAFRYASKYINLHSKLYPEEARELRERGFKGGIGKRKKRNAREEIIQKSIADAIQRNRHYRARAKPKEISDRAADEVIVELREQGIYYARDDMRGLILDILRNKYS